MSDEMLNNKETILFMISREPHTLFLVEQLAHFTDYLFDGNTYSRIDSRFESREPWSLILMHIQLLPPVGCSGALAPKWNHKKFDSSNIEYWWYGALLKYFAS